MPQIYTIINRPPPWGGRYILCFYKFEGYMETNFFADDEAAGFCCAAPAQTEVLTIDLTGDGDPGTGGSPWVFYHTAEFSVKFNVLSYAANGEVSVYFIRTVIVNVLIFCRDELHLGKICRIEEVGGLQMTVSLLVLCSERVNIYSKGHFGCLEIVSFRFHGSVKLREFAADVGDHHVFYLELYF